MKFEDALRSAQDIVRGDRNDEYGSFEQMMIRTAQVWTGILDHEVQPAEVAMCMAGLKLVRMQQNPDKEDSFTDALGYTAMAADILHEEMDPEEMTRLIRKELWLHGTDLPEFTRHDEEGSRRINQHGVEVEDDLPTTTEHVNDRA